MTRNEHEKARESIATAESLSRLERIWLRSHLEGCATCRDYSAQAAAAVRALRSQPPATDASRGQARLVEATQAKVRARAFELQRDRERLGVVCICCVAVTLGTVVPTAVMWRGFAWIAQQARLPGPLWRMGLFVITLIPAVGAGLTLLARGTYLAHRQTRDAR
jgi:predicted anti-sigma-YlaC factor YlaD